MTSRPLRPVSTREERMLKQSVFVAVVLAIGCVLVLGLGTLASSQDKKPPTATRAGLHQIHAAARALEQAHRHLERAEHHFGGHRVKALELVKLAEAEVKEAVACVGVEMGWMFADDNERRRLLQAFAESCRWAAELGCSTVMSASDRGRGDLVRAAANVREAGDIAAAHRVKLAIEFNSQAEQLNNLDVMRGIVRKASHPSCGLLLDTYHLGRSGATLSAIDDVALAEIAYVQYSDVPRTGLEPGKALDRLPPGLGSVPFKEIFGLLDRKGYRGFMSYEAPNPAAWARPADEVAREALEATRACLPSAR